MKRLAITALVALLGASTAGCGFYPPYRVYEARKAGEAKLAEALSSKQIAVQSAKAKWESADYEAKAEVRRAEGLAQAIQITGGALEKNPEYLRYLYVNNLAESHDQIIYVPTEAGLPILEAGHRPDREKTKPAE